ncbi:uncharacterized protein [Linepithema humile]|uniref:uncharacterized protein n=1 Tax=Linepithema humile TaxID=83485 RepID=UPI00351F5FCA
MVIERIQGVMVEHNSVKINTAFNGEFVAGDKTAVKTIATKNCELFPTSDLNEWYTRHVEDDILAALEEFQERDSGWALSRILNLTVNVNKFNPLHAGCHIELPCRRRSISSGKTSGKNDRIPTLLDGAESVRHRVTLSQISKFEKLNAISVNVFTTQDSKIVPLRLTDDKKEKHVNLLYVRKNNDAHFACIKNLPRLVSSQLSKHTHKMYICDRCLHYFYTREKLSVHSVDCGKMNDCAVVLPGEDKWLTFWNYNRKERVPFVVYADLECTLEKKEDQDGTTYAYQHHRAFSVGYYVSCAYDNSLSSYKSCRGEDCTAWFVNELHDLTHRVKAIRTTVVPMADLTREESEEFRSAVTCHVCEKPLTADDTRVRDHCHLTGRYRGAAHSSCNLNYIDSDVIPVIFHNLSGYDAHFIIKDVANAFEGNVELLPLTKERYISFTKNVKNTMDQKSKLCINLRSLTGETVSESDYAHATNVWQTFSIEDLGQYSDLYLKTDVLLLADIFENFRNMCIKSYGLDPAHYYTLPGYTWDAMLKYTRVKFELLTDIDMVLFVERGIRGGLSQCSNRYAAANNKYMPSYDPSEPSSYLMYFDVNNLYGWAMCQPLPYAKFRWVDDVASFDVMSVASDSATGYVLEVNLEYPVNLHDAHADLPFCPTCDKPPGKREPKLLATLYDKQRYVIHYRNLQQCVRHGLRIAKIHRVLQFAQSPWLRGYIELNTQFRTRAKNDFEKNLYKLMNNAVFGKTMENVRNHTDVRLVTQWDGRYGAEAMIAKPNFHSRSVFSEDLMAVELRKLEVKFDKPIYVGMCILDISKTCLYKFHYEYMAPLYRDNCKIMYIDTDSLIYFLHCEDAYRDMKRDISKFDTSDYFEDNAYGMPRANKKVPGLMKDENNGAIMTEFVGLRAKMYALRVTGQKDTKKVKGIKKSVVARTITFDDYTRCLNAEIELTRRQSCIRSKMHEVYTVSESKLALSPYDDKRHVVSGSTDTLP